MSYNRVSIGNNRISIASDNRFRTYSGLWTPEDLGDIIYWYDFSDESTVTIGATGISEIDNKGGDSDFNLTNNVASTQPLYNDTQNGLKVSTYDGIDDNLNRNVDFDSRYHKSTFLIVFNPISVSNAGVAVFTHNANGHDWEIAAGSDTNWDGEFRTNRGTNVKYNSTIGWQIIGWTADLEVAGGNIDLYLNGTYKNNTTVSEDFDTTSIDIILGRDRGGTEFLNCQIGEALLIPNTQNARIRTEGYLAHKWGLVDSLPSDHPYKHLIP